MSADRTGASSGDDAATQMVSVDFEDSETPNTVDTSIRINHIFNFHSANVLRVQLSIGGILKDSKLIRRNSSDLKATFTLHDDDWNLKDSGTFWTGAETGEAEGHDDIVLRKVEFAITRGSLPDDAKTTEQFVPLRGIRTDNFDTYVPFSSSRDQGSDIFYDAFSQAQIADQGTPKVPSDSEGSEQEGVDTPAVIDHGPEHSGRDDSITRYDNMTRLDRATRPIFTQQLQPVTPTFSAQNSRPTTAMSPRSPNQKDFNIPNDPGHNINLPHDNGTPIEGRNAEGTPGTIDERLPSEKLNTESGNDDVATGMDDADMDDETSELAGNITPTVFTSNGHPGNGSPAIEEETSKDVRASEDGSSTAVQSPKGDVRPPPKPLTKEALAKLDERKHRNATGYRLNRELLRRAGENDDKLLNRPPGQLPTPRAVRKFGTDEELSAANHHIQDVIKKQVELNRLLMTCTDRSIAANLRTRLPAWRDDGINFYERQLDAAITSARSNQPETTINQLAQTPTSRTGTKRGSRAVEESEDEDLPDVDKLGTLSPRIPHPFRRDESGMAGSRKPSAKKARASLGDLSLTDM